MTEWEKRVSKALTDSEFHFLTEYDHWLRVAFSHIPIGGDEHVIHGFHLAGVTQRLSAILSKHSSMALSMGQAHGDEDCQNTKERHKKKLADLPNITFAAADFTPHDAIKILQQRQILLAGDVENDVTSAIKEILLKHLTGLPTVDTKAAIAGLLKANMDRASLIVTTETTYAYNRGRLLSYKDNGADYVMFRAIMDDRTCPICSSRNGLILRTDDAGGNTPPVHGRCRCVLSPVFGALQPELLTPDALDWSKVAPLPKGWAA